MGRGATLEAERSLVQVRVVRTRAVAAEVTMDRLEKDLGNVFFFKFFFFHIKKYVKCCCSFRFYITV